MGWGQTDTQTYGHRDSMKELTKGRFFEKWNSMRTACWDCVSQVLQNVQKGL